MSSRIGSTFGWLLVLACWSAGDGAAMSIGEAVTTSPSEGAATQELRVPANTAYHEQGPGADGQLAVWFGRLQQAGKLKVAVELELAEGEAYLLHFAVGAVETEGGQVNARSDDRVEHVHGTGASGQRVDFGEFDVAAAGYGRFELSVELEAGQAAPHPSALLLDGSAVEAAHFNLEPRRNAASVHLFYPLPKELETDEVEAFYCEVTADEDPLWTYYMATGWHRGYFGMQVNSKTERRIIFSVWDSGGEAVDRNKVAAEDRVALVGRGEDVVTGSFGNEGTGGHSHLVFDWKTGERQRFLVTARADDATHTTFAGYYFRNDLGQWMLISSWRAPKEGRLLRGLYSFSENFGGANGHLLRKARYGNQWVRLADGTWHELTRASFSFDGTGKHNRLDRSMGLQDNEFFLSHGGFVEGSTEYGETFERPASSQPPVWNQVPAGGPWRAVLDSPGGELPFELEFSSRPAPGAASRGAGSGPGGDIFDDPRARGGAPGPPPSAKGPTPSERPNWQVGVWSAVIRNGQEELATGEVELRGDQVVIHLEPYDSRLVARLSPDGRDLIGHWEKAAGGGREARLGFHASVGVAERFGSAGAKPSADPSQAGAGGREEQATRAAALDGRWSVQFASDENLSVGLFRALPGGRAEGTFLTTLGDYRYLAGDFDGERLRLSCFDGGHAFLFTARLDSTGALAGDFWSRDAWHETWTAERDAHAELPDSFELTSWDANSTLADYAFPDETGTLRSLAEPAFTGKARILTLFGTWCPNCNDEAEYLSELSRRYGPRGLQIQGLAFELDDDLERSAKMVASYMQRHRAAWPVLFAATADKDAASAALPALDRVRAFPTTLFLDAQNRVRAVHTGYAGPATGAAHERLRERYETLIEELLAEDPK